jgi:hypothetical protein
MTKRDYLNFSSAAKPRFHDMAQKLGYEQITGVLYVKKRDGWYEAFSLEASRRGNPFFYFDYGVILPDTFPSSPDELKRLSWRASQRLRYKRQGAFPCATKAEIEESAAYAMEAYKREAVPWLHSLTIDQIRSKTAHLYGTGLPGRWNRLEGWQRGVIGACICVLWVALIIWVVSFFTK